MLYFSTSSIDSTAYLDVLVQNEETLTGTKGADVVSNWSDNKILTLATCSAFIAFAKRKQNDCHILIL